MTRTTELQAEQIAAWLRERPYFFTNHAELLSELRIPHQAGTVSLLEYQAQLLREENTRLRERLDQLTQTAETNSRIFHALRKLMLALLAANSLDELLQTTERCLRAELQVPQICLLLFNENGPLPTDYPQHPIARAKKAIGSLLKGGGQLCGALREKERSFLFAGQCVKSAAVLPLRGAQLYGVLALGSPDPERYRGAQGTLFVDYLAEVLPCLLKRFIPTQQA